jgi:hypothetical protein
MRTFLLTVIVLSVACGGPKPASEFLPGTGGKASAGTGGATATGGTTSVSSEGGATGTGGAGAAMGTGGTTSSAGTTGSGGSKGGTSGTTRLPGNCHDGAKNQDETDVDCGGAICAPRCTLGKGCLVDGDCAVRTPALQCLASTHKCTDPCNNTVQDGDETGVDCGGTCPLKCVGDACKDDSNCQSDSCDPSKLVCIPRMHPLDAANLNQACWDTLAATFNPNAVTAAQTKLIPCLLLNRCCKKIATTCTDTCFTDRDAVCGVNKTGGDDAPYRLITAYYAKCVVP